MPDDDSKAKAKASLDNNPKQGPFGTWEDLKKSQDDKKPTTASSSSPDCPLDWSPYADADDFMQKLNFWVWECQQWKNFHAQYPALVAQSAAGGIGTAGLFPFSTLNSGINRGQNPINATGPGVIYAIPPLWKRFVAEVIDCLLLLVLKITLLSLFLNEFIQFRDLEDIRTLVLDEEDIFSSLGVVMYEHSAPMLVIGFIHRLVVIIYEAYSLYAYPSPTVGGATMGKLLMGIKVVACTSVHDLGNGRVRVIPAGNLAFKTALWRSVLKNGTTFVFLPACLSLLSYPHNRTGYDLMCNCIVVENVPTTPGAGVGAARVIN